MSGTDYALLPGDAQPVSHLISLPPGEAHRSNGRVLLTDVGVDNVSLFGLLEVKLAGGLLDPNTDDREQRGSDIRPAREPVRRRGNRGHGGVGAHSRGSGPSAARLRGPRRGRGGDRLRGGPRVARFTRAQSGRRGERHRRCAHPEPTGLAIRSCASTGRTRWSRFRSGP